MLKTNAPPRPWPQVSSERDTDFVILSYLIYVKSVNKIYFEYCCVNPTRVGKIVGVTKLS